MRLVRNILITGVVILTTAVVGRPQSKPNQATVAPLVKLSESFEHLSSTVGPAVVQIAASGYTPTLGTASSSAGLLRQRSSGGSGVILSPDGYIVTNLHVVDGARRVQVLLSTPREGSGPQRSIVKPGGQLLGAQIVGVDSETDIALLKVEAQGLPYLELGNSDELHSGQVVLAFGSPLGLENSVTMGVVSAVARQFERDNSMIYIQTDAPINPGNSGGPLVSCEGRVMGINTSILSQSGGSEGLGFAVPSNIVKTVYEQIRDGGRVRRGVIGVNAQTINPLLAAGLGLTRDWGVVIADVYPGSPAERAGLQSGDIILALDNKLMENGRQFDVNLYSRRRGDQVRLDVMRGTEPLTTLVDVVERQDEAMRFLDMVTPERNLIPRLGVLAINLDSDIAAMIPNVRVSEGVVVASHAPGTSAWDDSFEPGDIILAVNTTPVRTIDGVRAALEAVPPGAPLVLSVERLGRRRYIALQVD